jgi:hypothetical protein
VIVFISSVRFGSKVVESAKKSREEEITPVHPKAVNRDCDSGDKREGRGMSNEEGSLRTRKSSSS